MKEHLYLVPLALSIMCGPLAAVTQLHIPFLIIQVLSFITFVKMLCEPTLQQ
jgi:hypothetical protein